MIFKALSAIKIYTEFEQLSNSLINSFLAIFSEIEKELDMYLIINIRLDKSQGQRNFDKKIDEGIKELMLFNKFDDKYYEETKDSVLFYSKGRLLFEKKVLESTKVEVLKNYFLLYDIMCENRFENISPILSTLSGKLTALASQNQYDENNLQICVKIL